MAISVGMEKAFDKIQHPLLLKVPKKLGMERTCLNIRKADYDKPIANIILSGEKPQSIFSIVKNKAGMVMSSLFPGCWGLSWTLRDAHTGGGSRERRQSDSTSSDVILHTRPWRPCRKPLETMNTMNTFREEAEPSNKHKTQNPTTHWRAY